MSTGDQEQKGKCSHASWVTRRSHRAQPAFDGPARSADEPSLRLDEPSRPVNATGTWQRASRAPRSPIAVADVEVIGALGLVGVLPGHEHAIAAGGAVAGVIAVGPAGSASWARRPVAASRLRTATRAAAARGRRTPARIA